ncbi:MAG: uracil-DNA glycosylase [Alphaproteobacteria bacterium]|jgi:uracil-DNA glycosylase family 4
MAHSDQTDTLSRQQMLAMLRWQVDAGVDEVVGADSWNRYAEPPKAPKPVAVPAARRPVAATPTAPASPVRLAVTELDDVSDLADLKDRLEAFDGGALQRTATNTVFGEGGIGVRIMFVGEAPGAEEDRQGIPFIGPSGILLDRMLAAIGLSRSDAYIANTLYWRPPGNRTPTPEERNICMPFLMRQIELVGPKVIVPLGGPAAQALLKQASGITRLRGRWFDFESRPDMTGGITLPALPTFHPTFLLSQPSQKRQAWQDLKAIRDRLND